MLTPRISRSPASARVVKERPPESTVRKGEKFVLYSAGVLVSYLIYGYMQEGLWDNALALSLSLTHSPQTHTHTARDNSGKRVYADTGRGKGERFSSVSFVLLVQCLVNWAVARTVWAARRSRAVTSGPSGSSGWWWYPALAAAYSGAMFCSSRAVYHVDYPTQVIAKCCKPIPVLLLGLLFRRSRTQQEGQHGAARAVSVLAITAGVAYFMYGQSVAEGTGGKRAGPGVGSSMIVGYSLLAVSLALDGVTGFLQDKIVRTRKTRDESTSWELMRNVNVWSSLLFLAGVVLPQSSGGLFSYVVPFARRHPEVLIPVLVSACVSAVGQSFIYLLVAEFDSLLCSIVTTARKFLTVLLSVVWYGHPLSWLQWLSVVAVFSGVFSELRTASSKKARPKSG